MKQKKLIEVSDSGFRLKTSDIYAEVLYLFGKQAQKEMAKEECSELINALCKETRNRVTPEDIIQEIADVQIMCAQLSMIYGVDKVAKARDRKLRRLVIRVSQIESPKDGFKEYDGKIEEDIR